jgi:hypothetical protein
VAACSEMSGRVFETPAVDFGCDLNHQFLFYANKTLFRNQSDDPSLKFLLLYIVILKMK